MLRERRQLRRSLHAPGIALMPFRLLDSAILRGSNKYHSTTVIRQRIDLGAFVGVCSGDAGVDFATRYIERFAGLEKMQAQGHMSAAFLDRLHKPPGVSMLEALFEATLAVDLSLAFAMNSLAPLQFAEILPTRAPSQFDLVWQPTVARLSRGAAKAGLQGVTELLPDELRPARQRNTQTFDASLGKLLKVARRRRRSLSTEVLALAARQRGLPCEFIGGTYLLLGQGIAQSVIHPFSVAATGTGWRKSFEAADERQVDASLPSGRMHELLVVGDRVVAALQVVPAAIRGDGHHTIKALIGQLNRDPRRNGVRQCKVPVDDELRESLRRSGYSLADVLEDGRHLTLESTARISRGATHTDVSDLVHPDNREIAVRAAVAAGLRLASIDLVTQDIATSHRDNDGRITGVRARPALHTFTWPRHGQGRNVGLRVSELVFPRGRIESIPLLLVVGGGDRRTLAKETHRLLHLAGKTVGLASGKNALISGQAVASNASTREGALRFLLQDPRTEIAVSALSPKRIARRGLGVDRCQVAAILDPENRHEAWKDALSVLAKATTGMLVISTSNPLRKEIMTSYEPQRLLLVARSSRDTALRRHILAGGAAVYGAKRRGRGYTVIQRGREIVTEVSMATLIDAQSAAVHPHRIQQRMFGLALAYGAGLTRDELAAVAQQDSTLDHYGWPGGRS